MSAESAPRTPTQKPETLYGTLGVGQAASPEEIKKAFREKAKVYHPDSARDGIGNPQAFIKLMEAYTKLGDTNERAAYDRQLSGGSRFGERRNPPQQENSRKESPFNDAQHDAPSTVKGYEEYLRRKQEHDAAFAKLKQQFDADIEELKRRSGTDDKTRG
jgi:DnaJ-class molecular chaperone